MDVEDGILRPVVGRPSGDGLLYSENNVTVLEVQVWMPLEDSVGVHLSGKDGLRHGS